MQHTHTSTGGARRSATAKTSAILNSILGKIADIGELAAELQAVSESLSGRLNYENPEAMQLADAGMLMGNAVSDACTELLLTVQNIAA